MEYVMVPVPEELVGEVEGYMKWKLAQPKIAESPDAVRSAYRAVDESLRTLVRYVAEVTADEGLPTLLDVAEKCGISTREVVGSITEFSTMLQSMGHSGFVVLPRVDERPRPDGVTEWEHRVIEMSDANAELILSF